MSIKNLASQHRVLEFLHRAIEEKPFCNAELSDLMATYILRYLDESGTDLETAFDSYQSFIADFNNDIRGFMETGAYPAVLEEQRELGRASYDEVLLISCLVSPHRYQIMALICEQTRAGSDAVFVGCGPGLEIALVADKFAQVHAFDLSLGAAPQALLPDVSFYVEYFPSKRLTFGSDAIYLIELLEHLDDPLPILRDCHDFLRPGGRIYMTTATNLPQFDHLYNFPSNHSGFLAQLERMGLTVVLNIEIPHVYQAGDIGAKNHFIVVQKVSAEGSL